LIPDFAVEVVSPSDYPNLIQLKIEKYLGAGIPLLVMVYPDRRTIRVYRHGSPPVDLEIGDVFDGGDVLPGFRLPVAEIFR
jgi:Uma2 family endonuclease